MGLNNYFKLSGSFERPPYPLPAGFKVTKIPAFLLTLISEPNNSKDEEPALIAD